VSVSVSAESRPGSPVVVGGAGRRVERRRSALRFSGGDPARSALKSEQADVHAAALGVAIPGRLASGERDLAHETASCTSDVEPNIYERAAGRSLRSDGSDRWI